MDFKPLELTPNFFIDGRRRRVEIPFKFRNGPIPGIHRFGSGHCCRRINIKTTQERRWSLAHKEFIRGRRSFCNLPNPWDDYNISALYDLKSWKKVRKNASG